MALTLIEMAKIEENQLKQGVISTFLLESNVMGMIPWDTISALSTTVIRYKSLPSVGFRYINDSFAESTGTFDQIQESVYSLGGDIDVDNMLVNNAQSVVGARATQTELKLKAIVYTFNQYFVTGDQATDAKGLDGIKKRVAALPAAQSLIAGGSAGNGVDVIASSTNSHLFVDLIDKLAYLIDGHNPDALLMNRESLLAMRKVFRRLNLLDVTRDQFGRNVDHYGSIPLYDMGVQSDQATQIIPNTETQGTATDCTSIYAVKYGSEAYVGGLQQYPLRVADFGELETKPVYRTRVEWPVGLATWHPRCLARLSGLRCNT